MSADTDDSSFSAAHEDAEAAASAESVQGIYSALAPEALDSEADVSHRDVLDDDQLARHRVHAILVCHDGQRWLDRTLATLGALDTPLSGVVAVDTDSRDQTPQLLIDSPSITTVVDRPRGTGFPAAVAAGYDVLDEAVDPTHEWLWVLHDDSAPEPDCLRELLTAAVVHDAAVVGPKALDWAGRRRLVEMGVSITGSGRRYTGIEAREYDQGQHDDRLDVLAVGTAGMLVRRDVWDDLGGLDSRIDIFRDDVDFGWRARLCGHRVVVAPHAIVAHAAAATTGRRRPDASGSRASVTDRRNAVYVLLANAGRWTFIPVLLRTLLGTVLRAIGFVLGKVPAVAWDELVAMTAALRPSRLVTARRRRSSPPRTGSIHGLRPTLGTQARHAVENAGGVVGGGGGGHDTHAGSRRATTTEDLVGDEHEDLPVGPGWAERVSGWTGLWLVPAVSVVVVIAARTVLFGGDLFGGALLPAPASGSDWWSTYLAGWHPVGLGSPASAPPSLAILAGASVLTLGNASLLVSVLMIGAVPAAVATAWWALSGVVDSSVVRVWAALTYGVVLLATGALAAGRLGTSVVAVLAPLLVRAAAAALPPRAPLRRAWLAGLLLGAVAAFAPVVWPVVAAATSIVVVAFSRSWTSVLRWVIVVVVPAAVLLPWLSTLASHRDLWASEIGLTGQGSQLSDPALPVWAPLMLSSGGPGSVAAGVLAGVVVLALTGLVLAGSRTVIAGWVLAITALLAAVLVSRVLVSTPAGEGVAAGWPGPAVVIAGLGVVAALAVAADRGAAGLPTLARAIGAAVAAASTVAALVLGLSGSTADPLTRGAPTILPVYVVDEATGPDRVSSLVLRRSGTDEQTQVTYTVLRDDSPRLGEADVTLPVGSSLLDAVVADLVAGRGEASASALAQVGIRYVIAPPPLDAALDEALDGQAGLVRASAPEGGSVWRVEGVTGRVRLLDDAGDPAPAPVPSGPIEVDTEIDADGATLLTLAELADPGWRASVDGEDLSATTHSETLQAFTVSDGSGRLQVWYEDPERRTWLIVQAVLLGVVAVLLLPTASRRRDSLEGAAS